MTNQGLLPPRIPPKEMIVSPLPQKERNPAQYEHIHTWAGEVNVRVLALDHTGEIWGAGSGGVVRWIVTQTQINYRVWQVEHGLADGDVLSLLIAPNNHIFVGHASGKVSEFDHHQWHIHETGQSFAVRALGLSLEGHVLACTDVDLFDVHTGKSAFADTVPAPPLCVTSAFNRLWLGAESGLYERKDGAWHLHRDVALRSITSIQADNERLWLTSASGAWVGLPGEEWEVVPIKDTIYSIAHIYDHVLAGTATGLWMDYGQGFQKWWPKPTEPAQAVRNVIVSGGIIIHTTPDNLQHIDTVRKTVPRLLLPERQFAPRDVRRVFKADKHTLIQALDGTIWLAAHNGLGWKDVTERPDVVLSSALMLNNEWIVGINGLKGLATLTNGYLKATNALSFVVDLIHHNQHIYAATVNGVFRSADGKNWQGVTGITQGSMLGLVSLGDKLFVMTTQGIYAGTDNLKRLPEPESIRTFAADENSIIIVDKTNTLYSLDLNGQNRKLDMDVGMVLSTALIGDLLAIGTPQGLRLVHRETLKPANEISAPFTSAIIEMKALGNILWLLTASGSVEVKIG